MVDIAQRNHTRALEDLAKAIKDNTRALNNMIRHQQSIALTMQDVSSKVDAFNQLFANQEQVTFVPHIHQAGGEIDEQGEAGDPSEG